jgi:DNA-binding CsgD family transcriptional regulator
MGTGLFRLLHAPVTSSTEDIGAFLELIANQTGFSGYRMSFVAKDRARDIVDVNNQSAQWAEESQSFSDAVVEADPIWSHLSVKSSPLLWGRQQYKNVGLDPFYSAVKSHGMASGMCMSVRASNGDLAALGFTSESERRIDTVNIEEYGALSLAVAKLLDEFSAKIVVTDEAPKLSPKELAVIRWSAQGKTAWEVGGILGISKDTVEFHLKNIKHKLKATNKHHALILASRAGLL